MPLYEYECQACGNRLEAQQRMADSPLVTCPKCGKDELQKLISATAFHLKGGGWYKDLYSSSKPGESATSSTAAGTTPAKTETTGSTSDAGAASTPAAAPSSPSTSSSAGTSTDSTK